MKVLILSNNCLSLSNSNGRTMLNMLGNFKNSEILNVCCHSSDPAFEMAKIYKINEKKLLNPFCKKFGIFLNKETSSPRTTLNKGAEIKRSAFKLIIRSFLWKIRPVKNEILKIAREFEPDVIVVQCGDSDFLIKIGIYVSISIRKKLVSYNTENYIFKNWDYIKQRNKKSIFFRLFQQRLRKTYDCLYKQCNHHIYLTKSLQERYNHLYPNTNSSVIYNSSFLKPKSDYKDCGDIVYAGNIGLGRFDELKTISKLIYKKFHKKIIVYSNITNQDDLIKLENSKYLKYGGLKSYDELREIITSAFINIHVESFDKYFAKDSSDSFSTKIADLLSCGRPFLFYGPDSFFVYKYLESNNCAFLANNFEALNEQLEIISTKKNIINDKIKNALNIAKKNHNFDANSLAFYKIIKDVAYDN